ncbi:MAG: aldehyde dehydrogenase [Kangiellaceae bacterium]|nr:aldehyde dehydrogenase [Kangiellaceae bacterium]
MPQHHEKLLTRSPIDNSIYVERDYANDRQISDALKLARLAQQQWKLTTIAERAAICHRMVDAFVANGEEVATQLCWMMGRPIRFAQGEVKGVEERARVMIALAEQGLKPVVPEPVVPETNGPETKAGVTRYIKREPLGVVFVIAPWNYPYLTAINSVIPAIMAGNSVVLKHSAQTPLCAEQFACAFAKAGLPDGVFQYLHLTHAATAKILSDGDIDHAVFTGSVEGGAAVERALAGRFKCVGLELGGKDPAYIRQDADIEKAAASCVDGAFFNSGQSCCGIERIYVHQQVFDEFVEQACRLINDYRLGRSDDPETTLGPVINAKAAGRVRRHIDEAIAAGAKAHIDAGIFPAARVGSAYVAPQLLTQVDHSMAVMSEESFGPVVGVMAVADDQQATGHMNDSAFGLTACIYTNDIEQAESIAEQLDTGTVLVNRCDYLDPALAWTGVKQSGRGCSLSVLGYEQLTRPKSFYIKHNL